MFGVASRPKWPREGSVADLARAGNGVELEGTSAGKAQSKVQANSGGRNGEMTEDQLIQGVLAGNRSSADTFYDHLLPVVNRTLRRVLGRHESDHDDLVQQSFEQIVKTLILNRYRGACNLKSWASALTARVAITELRNRYRQRRVIVDDPIDLEQIAAMGWGEQDAIQLELDLLRRALCSLKSERAVVVYLHDVEGYRLTEISVMLGASVTAVQSLLVRGRTQLLDRHRQLDTCQTAAGQPLSEDAP